MSSLSRAFAYLIALQVQAVGLILVAWWGGEWLDENYPIGVSWLGITLTVSLLAIVQMFYVTVRTLIRQDRNRTKAKEEEERRKSAGKTKSDGELM